jgi:hypothetical protein
MQIKNFSKRKICKKEFSQDKNLWGAAYIQIYGTKKAVQQRRKYANTNPNPLDMCTCENVHCMCKRM